MSDSIVLEAELTQSDMQMISSFVGRAFNSRSRGFLTFTNADLRDLTIEELKSVKIAIGLTEPELQLNVVEAMVAFFLLKLMELDKEGQRRGKSNLTITTAFTRRQLDEFLNAISSDEPAEEGK